MNQQQVDFGKDKDGQDWLIINDGVMGGLSQGEAQLKENSIYFQGIVSLANNGGFSSLRSPYQTFDFGKYKKVQVRLRGKGQVFALTINTDRRYWMPYFKKEMVLSGNEWEMIELDLSEFQAFRLGQPLGNFLSQEDLAQVIRIGFITNKKQEGPFFLEVDYIKFLE